MPWPNCTKTPPTSSLLTNNLNHPSMLRPSYPDVGVGNGFTWICPTHGTTFRHPVLMSLHKQVSDYCKANNLTLDNDEFDDNVCRNTVNIVCTEGPRGTGDVLHVILNPIGKVID